MAKVLIASTCGAALLLSGCGASSSSSGDRKTACVKAAAAKREYHQAGSAVGLNFSDRTKVEVVITDAGLFRARLRALEPLTSTAEQGRLQALASVLEQHEKLLGAVTEHNLAAARKYARNGFEERLTAGLANFEKICSSSGSG